MIEEAKSPGDFIRHQRTAKEMTQQEFATALGKSRQYVSLLESDTNLIPDKLIDRIHRALRLTEQQMDRFRLLVELQRRAITSDPEFAEVVVNLVAEKKGHLYVISGKSVGFSDPRLFEITRDAIQQGLWKITFFYLENENVIGLEDVDIDESYRSSLSGAGKASGTSDIQIIVDELLGTESRSGDAKISFVGIKQSCLKRHIEEEIVEEENCLSAKSKILYDCLRTFHRQTALSIFVAEGDDQGSYRVASLFSRNSQETQYSWLLLNKDDYDYTLSAFKYLLTCKTIIDIQSF